VGWVWHDGCVENFNLLLTEQKNRGIIALGDYEQKTVGRLFVHISVPNRGNISAKYLLKVSFRRGNGRKVEFIHKSIKYVGRDKRGYARPDVDIFYAERK